MNIFTENPDFYPTPNDVIDQMMLNEDIFGKTVLEPSAGKGNIVDWLKNNGAAQVIACEKDPNLRKLLDNKCDIIADDFLTVTAEQISHVDYIVMNPPFSEGAKHILHAFDIAPAGCTIVALCNDSNLQYDHWTKNQFKEKLIEAVELYGQKEYLGDIFSNAERRTNVYVSIVKLYKEGEDENEFKDYFFSQFDEDTANMNQREGIMQYNIVRDLVNRYVTAVKLFDETLEAANKINEAAKFPEAGEYDYIPIKFGTIKDDGHAVTISHQQYKKELQKYYWRIIFKKLHMEKYATKQLRQQINKFIEQQTNVPFTMGNIYRVIDMVVQTNGQRMQTALLEAFDLICSFSAENSTAGPKWKTNANYMVNRKFIVPYMCNGYHDSFFTNKYGYGGRMGKEAYPLVQIDYRSNADSIEDVCKALCFITGTNYDHMPSLRSHHDREEWGEWWNWGFFRCKAYKKGTMHFEFLDENVWFKFNCEVARLRGWELPKKPQKTNSEKERKATTQTTIW